MKRLRLLVSADAVGGVWDYTVTLVRELRRRGHVVLVAVLGRSPADAQAALGPGVALEWRELRLEWMPGSARDVDAGCEWLAGLARSFRADVAHLGQFAPAAAITGVPTVVVAHSDVLSWFSEVRGEAAPPAWGTYARRTRAALRRASAVVAPSRHQSALLARHFGRPADRVIRNAAPPPARAPEPRTGPPLVVMAGRAWDEAKGAAVLDDALLRLGPAAPHAVLLGDVVAPHVPRFEARRLAAVGRVPKRELHGWFRRAWICVAPSSYEPFGLAPLEAALRGCALVLGDVPSLRELWGGAAVHVPPRDAGALAGALGALLAEPRRVEALAAAARRRALSAFSPSRMADRVEDLYAAVLGRSVRPAAVSAAAEGRAA